MHAMQYSIPILNRPTDNIYSARFIGPGLGWLVLDYRGRKVVRHGGSWGASVTMIPEENLGVAVLNNIDIEGVAGMLSYDVLDAYLVGPSSPGTRTSGRPRGSRTKAPAIPIARATRRKPSSSKYRIAGTSPLRPLEDYAGTYQSPLYGDIVVKHEGGQLLLDFAGYTTRLTHWHHESFYVRAPTRITYDWLLTFSPPPGNRISTLTVKHVGWDNDEPDHLFTRQQ